jgi:glutathione S-transferase
MQLFYSSGSPFARAVRVALRETGLLAAIAEQETTLRDPAAILLPHNPVGRVPTLLLADGTALTETALILPFLDTLGGTYRLMPDSSRAPLGLALGAMDGMAVWNRELRRPPEERSPSVIALETTRLNRAADALEAQAAAGQWALGGRPRWGWALTWTRRSTKRSRAETPIPPKKIRSPAGTTPPRWRTPRTAWR